MRYYCYELPDNSGVTMSEREIRNEYYPFWLEKMYEKFGKEHVDATYSFEECLEDWVIIHHAWESTDDDAVTEKVSHENFRTCVGDE